MRVYTTGVPMDREGLAALCKKVFPDGSRGLSAAPADKTGCCGSSENLAKNAS
ncbi:hypothetical protein [Caproicibacter sp.]|uniref:hypothetical protein n=1 Tax=Caproicibacter sp. TaxID=2814884 RepID=UPI0039897E6C